MIRPRRLTLILVAAMLLLSAMGVAAFFATHPRCELCGRRYGPLIAHPYRHLTTKRQAGRISEAERKRMAATAPIIHSLPPLTPENQNLTLSPELLVGHWESQDSKPLPVLFRDDGTVELGFIQEDGKWLMATGTWQIQGSRVVTRTQYQGTSLGQPFTFARGVLHAPRGPSPQIVWRKTTPPAPPASPSASPP
jgi:hypothetical protein